VEVVAVELDVTVLDDVVVLVLLVVAVDVADVDVTVAVVLVVLVLVVEVTTPHCRFSDPVPTSTVFANALQLL
jgi:hypothetical protein